MENLDSNRREIQETNSENKAQDSLQTVTNISE